MIPLLAPERRALEHGAHSARLDTFDWQAADFYERRGYSKYASLPDYPAGHTRLFMSKRLVEGSANDALIDVGGL